MLSHTERAAWQWVYSEPRDRRPWIMPNIRAALSSEDYRTRRDPAIQAILSYVPNPDDIVDFPDRLFRAFQLSDEV